MKMWMSLLIPAVAVGGTGCQEQLPSRPSIAPTVLAAEAWLPARSGLCPPPPSTPKAGFIDICDNTGGGHVLPSYPVLPPQGGAYAQMIHYCEGAPQEWTTYIRVLPPADSNPPVDTPIVLQPNVAGPVQLFGQVKPDQSFTLFGRTPQNSKATCYVSIQYPYSGVIPPNETHPVPGPVIHPPVISLPTAESYLSKGLDGECGETGRMHQVFNQHSKRTIKVRAHWHQVFYGGQQMWTPYKTVGPKKSANLVCNVTAYYGSIINSNASPTNIDDYDAVFLN